MTKFYVIIGSLVALLVIFGFLSLFSGDGGLKRLTTISGVYTVEKPDGYNVVCFMEKGGNGMQCLPLTQVRKVP